MIRGAWDLVYGATPAEFESSYGLEESVQRLAAATGRSVFSALTRQRAVGTVKPSRVSLQRVIPMFGNSFKPFFIGEFQERNGRVVLTGRFTMIWPVKTFMSVWFGFLLVWTALPGASIVTQGQTDVVWFPLSGLGMIGAGIALVWIGKWFARNDAAWLSNVIQEALSKEPPNNRVQGDVRQGARA